MDPSSFATVLVGVLAPLVTQLVRKHLFRWDDKAAHLLALVIAAGGVSATYFMQDGNHSFNGWLGNFGTAFTLSQVVFHQLVQRFKNGPLQIEDDEDDGGPGTSGPTPLPTGYPGGAISGDTPNALPARFDLNPVGSPFPSPVLTGNGSARS